MPLKIEMKQGDRIIINGAVLEAASPHTKIVVHNQASILRAKEILTEEQAITPATRVYYALQSAYLFPEHADQYLTEFSEFVQQYLIACPSASNIIENITAEISQGQLYKALKCARALVMHQHGVLHEFEEQLGQLAQLDDEDIGSNESSTGDNI
ncbi:MAG: flagellum biosynthesis protein FlbT [Gammaproteobacteria bacterium]|jgi:flagellar biosynthesis repressor protein FlbT|nr:flagellum biosynthesis protein FlbT [Gammaproteobacteria bacterium]MBT4890263.1 flagellum biosynthesis protein FlbT [Rhodospirillales bacterium]